MATAVNVNQSQPTVANTNRDGTGVTVVAWTPNFRGSYLIKILLAVPGISLADMIRLFWYDGTHTYLFQEIAVLAVTPSVSVPIFTADASPLIPIFYPSGWILKAATNIGQATNIIVSGIDI